MHTNRISPARKILLRLTALCAAVLLTGCETVTLTDLTPNTMAENPSQIYTFSLRATPRTNTVASITANIIINGQSYPMKPSALGQGLYDFDFQFPAGQDRAAYYYLVNYTIEGNQGSTPREAYTDVQHVQVVRRYVLSLEVNRGPVGARIAVLGRGFTPNDKIFFDGTEARTNFDSASSLSFFVPALEPHRNYNVTLSSPAGNSPVGTFRIDPSTVTVTPTSLNLRSGEEQQLTFTLPHAAPAGGTLLDITTDIPESVIMEEIVIPAGQTYRSVTIKGGRPGTGSLFLKGFGAGELTIPVTVQ